MAQAKIDSWKGRPLDAYPPGFPAGCAADLEVTRHRAVDNIKNGAANRGETSASGLAN
jgi:hypothetical protein